MVMGRYVFSEFSLNVIEQTSVLYSVYACLFRKNGNFMAHHPQTKPNYLSATGIKPAACYQCGKCSAGCPQNCDMDYPPSMVMRMLQYNAPDMEEKLLKSFAIWACLSCEMCYQRCPMQINVPAVMDALRQESIRKGWVHREAADIVAFHRSFLQNIEQTGRLHEAGMVMNYKLKTGNWLQDVNLSPAMMKRGKLHLFAKKIEGHKAVRRLFNHHQNQ